MRTGPITPVAPQLACLQHDLEHAIRVRLLVDFHESARSPPSSRRRHIRLRSPGLSVGRTITFSRAKLLENELQELNHGVSPARLGEVESEDVLFREGNRNRSVRATVTKGRQS